jgi:hypothetical protein
MYSYSSVSQSISSSVVILSTAMKPFSAKKSTSSRVGETSNVAGGSGRIGFSVMTQE